MKNEKWEMRNGRYLFHRSMPHIPLRYMWGFQQFTLLRSVSAYCGSHGWCSVGWLIWPIRGRIRACGATFYKTTRCVSSGTLTIFIDFSGLKPGVPHKSVLSGDGIPSPCHHTTHRFADYIVQVFSSRASSALREMRWGRFVAESRDSAQFFRDPLAAGLTDETLSAGSLWMLPGLYLAD